MQKKILVITPFYPPNIGGAESFCFDLAKQLKKKYRVDVATIDWKVNKLFKGTGLRQFLEVFPRLFVIALSKTRKNKPDILYAIGLNSCIIASILNVLGKFESRCALLALYDFKHKSALFRHVSAFFLNKMRILYVEGSTGAKDIVDLDKKLGEKIVIFNHWCNQSFFKPADIQNDKTFRVLFVGRPIPEKGIEIIKLAEALLSKYKNIDFKYVENVFFNKLAKIYQSADVLVVPSLYSEGFPRVVIEAASCGCAVIASNKGALPELVKPFGIICEPTARHFKDAILKVKDHKAIFKSYTYEYARIYFSEKNAEVFL